MSMTFYHCFDSMGYITGVQIDFSDRERDKSFGLIDWSIPRRHVVPLAQYVFLFILFYTLTFSIPFFLYLSHFFYFFFFFCTFFLLYFDTYTHSHVYTQIQIQIYTQTQAHTHYHSKANTCREHHGSINYSQEKANPPVSVTHRLSLSCDGKCV